MLTIILKGHVVQARHRALNKKCEYGIEKKGLGIVVYPTLSA